MSSIRQPSQIELTRLHSIVNRLGDEWESLSAHELLARVLLENPFVQNPALVSSFGADSAVLLHIVSQIKPDAQVIFIDTSFHFPETLAYRSQLVATLGLTNVRSATVDPIAEKRLDARRRLHLDDPDSCCQLRKVSVLDRHLRMNDAWISGQRRSQSSTRSSVGIVEVDKTRGKLKFNPLANWTDSDIAAHRLKHDLPAHPLVAQGYPSIGCHPCTSAIKEGEDQRAGRWRGKQKLECGLHNRPNIIASSEYVA
jgi:phosphoadenosine phosphosulfate reductase